MVYVKFNPDIKKIMIKHTLERPELECGGFLYGNIKKEKEDTICNVDAIYYEKKYGSGSEFNFNASYIANAKKFLKQLKDTILIGTYHSHGTYPAIFSDTDRNELQKYFGKNRITLIYSPKQSRLIGEFMNENLKSEKTKIITK